MNLPIISLDIVNIDESHTRNLITHTYFDNYIDLNFKINNTMKEQYKLYTIHVPAEHSRKLDYDISILVFRIDMKGIGHIFVTLAQSTYDLSVSLYK